MSFLTGLVLGCLAVENGARRDRDPAPKTVGNPYHHEDERECFYRADGSGWWPWRFEDGVENRSGGTVCFREHTDPTRVIPPAAPNARAVTTTEHCPTCGGVFIHSPACPIPPGSGVE